MPVSVIFGGQFGSEGKGKVAHYFVQERNAYAAVRIGGPNSGHTVIDRFGNPVILKQLPTAAILPEVLCVIGPGSYIDPKILADEIARVNLPSNRLFIDPRAVIIGASEVQREKRGFLRESIGSTESGTGAAVIARASRDATNVKFAEHEESIRPYLANTTNLLRTSLNDQKRVVIEGTQGFGLSLLHSENYPYVTSRDTSAAAFVSEAGLSPLDVDEVIMVLRAFPIRVGGKSGPLPQEIAWDTVTSESGSKLPIIEHTSVTKNVRRVARFDAQIVRQAIENSLPTTIVLNHLDHIDAHCRTDSKITPNAQAFINEVESSIEAQIDYLGISPSILIPNRATHAKFKFA